MASRFKVNPALRRGFDTARVGERPMTKSGTMSKIFLMLALVTAAAGEVGSSSQKTKRSYSQP